MSQNACSLEGQTIKAYDSEDSRWAAVRERDSEAEGVFFYGVLSTGVFCRPNCPSRLAKRENVVFLDTLEEAEGAGFRACHRCRPKSSPLSCRQSDLMAIACRRIEDAEEFPNLASLAAAAGLSESHFHRMFKKYTGLTPKAYADGLRRQRVQKELLQSKSVTEGFYKAGFQSSGRFYAKSAAQLGMSPSSYRSGGAGTEIRFAVRDCSLGVVLVAATKRGICSILLGDNSLSLISDLQDRFRKAVFVAGDDDFELLVSQVVALADNREKKLSLPLDIQGTAFQIRVWEALLEIPWGETKSYSQIAEQIGQPKATRAVARACGSNPLAIAIPCHRVVRNDSSLSGYRWGIDRKAELLRRERAKK